MTALLSHCHLLWMALDQVAANVWHARLHCPAGSLPGHGRCVAS
jgi:hypothetical protein